MGTRKQSSSKEITELPEPSYFGLQAYWGGTKHMGGLEATRELIELCNIDKGKYILDVGCGVGATSCYIAKKLDCRVAGVDISKRMIDWSKERAKKVGVEDRVEFKVADAQDLPYDNALFDIVIGESVTTFLRKKEKAISEYVRVTKPRGYIGLNEETWLKTPPLEFVEYASRMWDIEVEIPTSEGWRKLFENAGLEDIVVRAHEFKGSLGEYINGIRQLGYGDFLRMSYRFLSMYARNPAVREYMKGRFTSLPKDFFEYLGYGIYVGRK